jgi:hypothetical protein
VDTTTIAETMERDIARLKSARPQLASRIERAEHILVSQLSSANRSRPVKVRVHADGSRSYRFVPDLSSAGLTSWTRRRGSASARTTKSAMRLASMLWPVGYWREPVSPLRSLSGPQRASALAVADTSPLGTLPSSTKTTTTT